MNKDSRKEKEVKKDEKFKVLSEEEFNKQLKKQVDNLKEIFNIDNKKKKESHEEER